jgi:hypothetical protein
MGLAGPPRRAARLRRAAPACPDDDIAGPGLAIDETAHIKKGARTAGVARQYAGITGQVENCVTTVFCAYVTPGGHSWIDWEPYLTEAWAGDTARRSAARIPEDAQFATKPDLAARIVTRQTRDGKLGIRWVAADEVYGRSSRFRAACEDADLAYALAVPEDFHVATKAGTFRADELAALAEGTFERRSCGPGSKGPRCFDWALVATASPRHFLLIRRSASDPDDMAFFYCLTPEGTPATMTLLVTIAGRRWPADQSFQLAKSVLGWDTSQARTWHAYQRHTALSALAMALLAAAQAQTNALAATPTSPPPPATGLPNPAPPPNPAPAARHARRRARHRPRRRPPAHTPRPALPRRHRPDQTDRQRDPPPDEPARRNRRRIRENARHRLVQLARRHQAIARWHHWRARLRALA